MKFYTLLSLSSLSLAFSFSIQDPYHSIRKRSASPQFTINADPNHLLLGGIGLAGAGLLVNHALGDPVGGAIKDHLGKPKGQRRPTNVEHIHHHHVTRPEYEEAYMYEWTPWQSSACSRSCGTGTMNQQRSRQCSQPNACAGHTEEARQSSCNSHECPVDGYWQAFSDWTDNSVCSRSCGGGTRQMARHRQCVGPYGGGHPCVGSSEDTKAVPCNTQACPTDGVWGPWKELSGIQSCRVKCGSGTVALARERTCVGPYNGGRPCTGDSFIESCVEDHRSGGKYTSVPSPSYGVGNGAISPRTLGDDAASRTPRGSLELYDGILTPDSDAVDKAATKPVYGPPERY